MNNVYDCVYIEDDSIFRTYWKTKAKENNINILILESVNDFHNHVDKISKDKTHIYLDSDLGEDVPPGEDFAVLLHGDGYKNVFMASSHGNKHFFHIPWIKNIGKHPPFASH